MNNNKYEYAITGLKLPDVIMGHPLATYLTHAIRGNISVTASDWRQAQHKLVNCLYSLLDDYVMSEGRLTCEEYILFKKQLPNTYFIANITNFNEQPQIDRFVRRINGGGLCYTLGK